MTKSQLECLETSAMTGRPSNVAFIERHFRLLEQAFSREGVFAPFQRPDASPKSSK